MTGEIGSDLDHANRTTTRTKQKTRMEFSAAGRVLRYARDLPSKLWRRSARRFGAATGDAEGREQLYGRIFRPAGKRIEETRVESEDVEAAEFP